MFLRETELAAPFGEHAFCNHFIKAPQFAFSQCFKYFVFVPYPDHLLIAGESCRAILSVNIEPLYDRHWIPQVPRLSESEVRFAGFSY